MPRVATGTGDTAWDWRWDETLYAGSADYYARGRMPYPAEVAGTLRREYGLDGTGRLLDVGCGPGSLTLLLAPLFATAVGVDADAAMIARAAAEAAGRGVANVTWRRLRAEDLPADLGTFRLVTFAQSFHWMEQEAVAARVRDMIEPGGGWVHVQANTHQGVPAPESGLPAPPWDAVDALIVRYLGPVRRAGRSLLPTGTRAGEREVLRAAGFAGPVVLDVGGGEVRERPLDEVVASVHSLSNAAPHLFGDRLAAFDADLRALLLRAAPDGLFAERTNPTGLVLWRVAGPDDQES